MIVLQALFRCNRPIAHAGPVSIIGKKGKPGPVCIQRKSQLMQHEGSHIDQGVLHRTVKACPVQIMQFTVTPNVTLKQMLSRRKKPGMVPDRTEYRRNGPTDVPKAVVVNARCQQ